MTKPNLFFIDDDESFIFLCDKIYKDISFELDGETVEPTVFTHESAEEALVHLREINEKKDKPLCIACIDYYFPMGMNGVDFYKKVREENLDLLIIFISSREEDEVFDTLPEDIIYLKKPFDPKLLKEAIVDLIKTNQKK